MAFTLKKRQPLLADDQQDFAQCHASTLVALPEKNTLVAAFFAGAKEGSGDTAIWLARSENGVWQPAVKVMSQPGVAHWNPVLHYQRQRLWLFYKVGKDVHSWITRVAVSDDQGLTWSAPRELVAGDPQPRGPVKNKLLVMSNGEWIAPASTENARFWDAFVDISADQGESWYQVAIPIEHQHGEAADESALWQGLKQDALWECDLTQVMQWDGVIQPTLWESKPGYIHALMRSTRGYIYRADSSDYGRSWCPAYATALPNNNSGIDVVRLDNGDIVLACNPVAGNWGRRYPVALLRSVDNGATWSQPWVLEEGEGEFSYPAIVQQGGLIHLTWTWNRKNIIYQTLTDNN